MTSVVADAARGNRDKVQPQTSHASPPQKQIQATAEQIRLAQIIDKNDADFEGKVKQLIEVTGRNQDECMVALHDCNGDVNRAINFLLEEIPATDSWETVGKKKSVGKEGATAETKERKVDKEFRGRGGSNRRGRGASRTQEGRTEENGFDSIPGERGERGRRGRGRGAGGRGRGRGDGVNRFSQGMGTFYTADYTGSADPGETADITTDGAGNWRNNLEDWAAEDWNEDLSETKVFTASFALASQSHATPGHGVELSSLLPKGADVDSDLAGLERSSPEPLTQSLVFTNSQQHPACTQTHSYASAAANSYASAAAGTYAQAASSLGPRPTQPDVQKTEPVSVSRITPVSSQVPVANDSPVGESSSPPPAAPAPLAWTEPKAEMPVKVAHIDLKAQPDPSPILSQLTQQQNPTLLSDLPAQGRNPSHPVPLQDVCSPVLKPNGETSVQNPTVPESHQPKQIRPQRRKMPPPSKIPSSAVEMPGSADVSGLNVQFGALDFASEATVESTGQSETSIHEPAPPLQSNMYSKQSAVSEPVTGLPPALPTATMEPRYTSPSLGLPTATASTPSISSRTESSSLHKEPTTTSSPTSLTNGFGEVRPSIAQDAVPSSTPQSTALTSENSMAATSLPLSVSSAPAPTPSTALPSLSSDVSGSLSAFSGSILTSNGLSNGAPGLSTNGHSAPSTGRSAPLQTTNTAGKAPPNLPQGVPPLLANQYIMGPGGLLPAYPIYGYEDLQMMQSRLPIDYYGLTAFPGTTTLAARDGGLANNPYSGEATKFARGDAPSPAPTTSLSSSQSESGTVPPQTQAPQNPGQAFLNPPLPPGYGYTSLPYYAGMPGVPSAFQYGPTVFMPPASAKQHAQYQHQAGYGGHTYASGFDDMSQAHAGGDYGKGYGSSSQSQGKSSNSTGKAPGLSGSASSDLGAAVYSKTQSFDKQGFPTVTPATFNLPSALGGTGPLNPGGAPGYAPAPFLHILPPHQQPPSQLLHHHIAQDTQAQRSQSSSMQKSQGKSSYNSSPYWAN
ncbi:Ubiquitin-associated protein 2 [Bagarius yarrelli]|uniref:Ubiquitin-associated protein 2 n=1 Tax=Bagarius yarrelli TaxID=175774 RepID=A0A556U294_BAGYA|nr:Ubiquitin-associated protein 2 [Bagarius yarrelli]